MRLFRSSANIFFVIVAMSLGLGACVDDEFMSVPAKDPGERALGGPSLSTGAYRMAIGDHVRVTVFGTTPIATEYTVDDTGAISIAPMGPLVVKETTGPE